MQNNCQIIRDGTINRINVHCDNIYTEEFIYNLMSEFIYSEYKYDKYTYIIYLKCNNDVSLEYLKKYISIKLSKLLPSDYVQNNKIEYGLFFNILQLDKNIFNIYL